jgi:hypothetical protein
MIDAAFELAQAVSRKLLGKKLPGPTRGPYSSYDDLMKAQTAYKAILGQIHHGKSTDRKNAPPGLAQ